MFDLKDVFATVTEVEETVAPVYAVVFDVVGTLVELDGRKIPYVEDFALWLYQTRAHHNAKLLICSSKPAEASILLEKAGSHDIIKRLPVGKHDTTYAALSRANARFLAINDDPLLPLTAGALAVIDPTTPDAMEFLRKKSYRALTLP